MNLPRPPDEFDAARLVVDVLKPLQPDERIRAIRWAQEKLGVLSPAATDAPDHSQAPTISAGNETKAKHELTAALNDPAFLQNHAAVDKMLHLLSAAQKLKPDAFEKILVVQGRNRRYFAKSSKEISDSGKSTQPRNIPGTNYWAMTNSPTPQKAEMLGYALRAMGFSPNAVKDAVATIF